MKNSRFTEEQIVGILKEFDAGVSAAELGRKYGISNQTFYKWRSKYSGMQTSDVKKLKTLEEENQMLKRILGQKELEITAIKAVLEKSGDRRSKREACSIMQASGLSQRRACEVLRLTRTSARYKAVLRDDTKLRERIKKIAQERRRFGYRRIAEMLRKKGEKINDKKVYRLYTEENLKVRRRARKRYATVIRCPMENASKPNKSWSMDFTSDSLYTGRRFRTLNVIDEFSRESLGIDVAFSIRSTRVTCLLDKLIKQFGKPASIKVDNGSEFRSGHTQNWAKEAGIELNFIEPGKPMQNAFIESFNGRFRDECLNENWFSNIWEAITVIEKWRQDYNTERPHSALGYLTPEQFKSSKLATAV